MKRRTFSLLAPDGGRRRGGMRPRPTAHMTLGERIGWYTGPRTPSGCREWTGTVDQNGYAQIRHQHRTYRVTRLVLGLAVDDPLMARHKCDNPICVEPSHLEPGTNKDNGTDASRRGRIPLGEASGGAKLTESEVRLIRALRAAGNSIASIGRRFNVGPSAVSDIWSGHTWRHIQ